MLRNPTYPLKSITPEIKECNFYFGSLAFLLVTGSIFLAFTGKAGSFLVLNSYHSFALNVFFINYTFLGDGIFALCLIALFFYRKKTRLAISLLISFLLSSIVVQVVKNIVNAPRPKLFFAEGQCPFLIEGVTHGGHASFPSGHTATAFAIATIILLFTRNKNLQLALIAGAALVGYSRIYLAQHFLIDVVIGSVIGSLAGAVAIYSVINAKILLKIISAAGSKKTEPAPTGIS